MNHKPSSHKNRNRVGVALGIAVLLASVTPASAQSRAVRAKLPASGRCTPRPRRVARRSSGSTRRTTTCTPWTCLRRRTSASPRSGRQLADEANHGSHSHYRAHGRPAPLRAAARQNRRRRVRERSSTIRGDLLLDVTQQARGSVKIQNVSLRMPSSTRWPTSSGSMPPASASLSFSPSLSPSRRCARRLCPRRARRLSTLLRADVGVDRARAQHRGAHRRLGRPQLALERRHQRHDAVLGHVVGAGGAAGDEAGHRRRRVDVALVLLLDQRQERP